MEIVSHLARPVVKDFSLEALTTHVTDENVELIKTAAAVKENLAFFRRLTVQKMPVVLSFLSEKEQLVCTIASKTKS